MASDVTDEWLKAQWLTGVLSVRMDDALGANGTFLAEVRRLIRDLMEHGGANMQTLELLRDVGRERGLTEPQMALTQADLDIVENPAFLAFLRDMHETSQQNPELARNLRKMNEEYYASGAGSLRGRRVQ